MTSNGYCKQLKDPPTGTEHNWNSNYLHHSTHMGLVSLDTLELLSFISLCYLDFISLHLFIIFKHVHSDTKLTLLVQMFDDSTVEPSCLEV